jgi:hypothetical protein
LSESPSLKSHAPANELAKGWALLTFVFAKGGFLSATYTSVVEVFIEF